MPRPSPHSPPMVSPWSAHGHPMGQNFRPKIFQAKIGSRCGPEEIPRPSSHWFPIWSPMVCPWSPNGPIYGPKHEVSELAQIFIRRSPAGPIASLKRWASGSTSFMVIGQVVGFTKRVFVISQITLIRMDLTQQPDKIFFFFFMPAGQGPGLYNLRNFETNQKSIHGVRSLTISYIRVLAHLPCEFLKKVVFFFSWRKVIYRFLKGLISKTRPQNRTSSSGGYISKCPLSNALGPTFHTHRVR